MLVTGPLPKFFGTRGVCSSAREALIESIRQGSVITWRHVNLRGEYDFNAKAANDERFDLEKILLLKIKRA